MKDELRNSFSQAVRLRDSGDFESAAKMLLRLSEQDPSSPAMFSVLGHVCWQMELREEAINAFRCAVRLSPKLEAASLALL
jgi:cytochrome c-type biogenesis protein CcmH/NrfG